MEMTLLWKSLSVLPSSETSKQCFKLVIFLQLLELQCLGSLSETFINFSSCLCFTVSPAAISVITDVTVSPSFVFQFHLHKTVVL